MTPLITQINQRNTIRLIPSIYAELPAVLSSVSDTIEELDLLNEVEQLTSARHNPLLHDLDGVNLNEFSIRKSDIARNTYGFSLIEAAFLHVRHGGSRFNSSNRGAWYCAFEQETSLAEVTYHKAREVKQANFDFDTFQYVSLLADFMGDFPDLRGNPDHTALNPDPEIGYPAGQRLAIELQQQGHPALLYPSVRYPSGTCLVALEPHVIQNVRRERLWDLTIYPDGSYRENNDH